MLICAIFAQGSLSTAISTGIKLSFCVATIQIPRRKRAIQNKVADVTMAGKFQLSIRFNCAICTAVVQVQSAADIIFSLFGVLLLTSGQKSRKVPALYFPVVLYRLFQGIR